MIWAVDLWTDLQPVLQWLVALLPGGLWCAFWLLCVNWRRAWAVLAEGAWVGVILLGFISALVWSMVEQRDCHALGYVTLPNFWWQLGCVAALIGVALICGWLQGVIRYAPLEVNVELPVGGHDHDHGHGRGHDHGDAHSHEIAHGHGHDHGHGHH